MKDSKDRVADLGMEPSAAPSPTLPRTMDCGDCGHAWSAHTLVGDECTAEISCEQARIRGDRDGGCRVTASHVHRCGCDGFVRKTSGPSPTAEEGERPRDFLCEKVDCGKTHCGGSVQTALPRDGVMQELSDSERVCKIYEAATTIKLLTETWSAPTPISAEELAPLLDSCMTAPHLEHDMNAGLTMAQSIAKRFKRLPGVEVVRK